ncbi:MAG: molybdate ABC transporter substrate-binding protein [Cyanobacteria bacterium J06641_5]
MIAAMKHHCFSFRRVLGLLGCMAIASCQSTSPTRVLTVSAAASLQAVLEAIAAPFQAAHPELAVVYNFGASGGLQQQIEWGAPVDIFFAAASQPMDVLAAKGAIFPDTREDIVANALVLIAPVNSTLQITALSQLKTAPIDRFAVGAFGHVPAGQYAKQVLDRSGATAPLARKFVFGSTVRGVLTAVEGGSADAGIVYATDAALSERVNILVTIPSSAHDPIRYPIAVVSGSSNPDAARQFIQFLQEDAAQQTFANFGFMPLNAGS